jgi:hypothetical protein
MAVAGLLACSGYARADAPKLSLDPTVLTAASTAPQGLLMQGLDKAGMGKTLADAKLNIYGWVESGYTYNHRTGSGDSPIILPGPFNHEYGNHYMLNQFVLRAERQVDTKNFDVGGMIEIMYGSDSGRLHPYGGLGFDGSDRSDNGNPNDPDSAGTSEEGLVVTNFNPTWQFDIPQAYVTINLPVGNGLQLMVGKFATILGYESFDAINNPFYSHSYIFSAEPFTHVGVLGSYQLNDQLGLKLGISRGWDMAMEDNNGCAIDVLGQVSYKFSKQVNFVFNYTVGPENAGDSSHYRVALDPIVYWQATEALKFGFEGLYIYDGGMNGNIEDFSDGRTHAYGDIWGAALYAGYKVNDNLTVNGRVEKVHGLVGTFEGFNATDLNNDSDTIPALSAYEITLGVTVTPMPKDQYLKGLSIRPEIRYDFTDSTAHKFFPGPGGENFKDQLTFACDVVFQF